MAKALCDNFLAQGIVTTGTTPVGTPTNVEGYDVVGFQIIGLATGTVQWEANVTSGESVGSTQTWVAVRATDLNTGTLATTASGDGISQFDCRGVAAVRARVTTLSRVNDARLDVYGFAQAETS